MVKGVGLLRLAGLAGPVDLFRFLPFLPMPLAVLPLLPAAVSLLGLVLGALLSALAAAAALRPSAIARLGRILWRQKPGLTVLALIALAIIVCPMLARSTAVAPRLDGQFALVRWPTFRGGLARTGHADRLPGPVQGGVCWSGGRGDQFYSSAAIAGENVIAVGSRQDRAELFCWEAHSGRLLWTIAPQGYRATFSSPVIKGGYLVCGEGLHDTPRSRLVAFRTDAAQRLVRAFEFSTQSHIECTPVIDNDRVYFTAGDDGVYCLSLNAEPQQRVVWHAPGDHYPDAETALAVYDGRVFVGLGRGGNALCVLDAESGSEQTRLDLPYPVFSPPAIVDGRLYLGMGDADYVHPSSGRPGEVRCLDVASLETLWSVETLAPVLSAVVVSGGEVIFATVGGQLFVADDEGQIQCRWQAAGRMLAAPAVTPEAIYCISCDGMFTTLDRRLNVLWRLRVGLAGLYVSSPVVYDGRVLVGTPHDGFLSIGAERTPQRGDDHD